MLGKRGRNRLKRVGSLGNRSCCFSILYIFPYFRQQIFAKQLKLPATKRAEILLQQRIEAARLRLTLLREEKEWILTELARKKTMVDESVHEVDKSTDEMTEKFHNLAKVWIYQS